MTVELVMTTTHNLLPMYDTVVHHVQTEQAKLTTDEKGKDVRYAKLSPETRLQPNSEYQVPDHTSVDYERLTEKSQQLQYEQKKSKLFVSTIIGSLIVLLLIATLVGVALASADWKRYASLSTQLKEMQSDMLSMEENIQIKSSFENCIKDVANCTINFNFNDIKPYCYTRPSQLMNRTVSTLCIIYYTRGRSTDLEKGEGGGGGGMVFVTVADKA